MDRGRADCPSLRGGGTKKDFSGFAVLSTPLFPLKGEVSNHKGVFDENINSLLTSYFAYCLQQREREFFGEADSELLHRNETDVDILEILLQPPRQASQ